MVGCCCDILVSLIVVRCQRYPRKVVLALGVIVSQPHLEVYHIFCAQLLWRIATERGEI